MAIGTRLTLHKKKNLTPDDYFFMHQQNDYNFIFRMFLIRVHAQTWYPVDGEDRDENQN